MLHRKLQILLTTSYYHMLVFGLMPTTLNISNNQMTVEKVSITFLIYSVCQVGLVLLSITFVTPNRVISEYMRNNIVIQWSLIVKLVTRIMTIFCCYGLVWLQRSRLIQLFNDFLLHWRRHYQLIQRLAGTKVVHQLQLELAGMLSRHLYANYGMVGCSILMQYRLLDRADLIQLSMSFVQIMLSTVAKIGFFTLLVLLSHQFRAIQLALMNLRIRARNSGCRKELRRIADMHTECLNLARRAFVLYDVINASTFVVMFVNNVNFLYHAVQFSNKSIKSNAFGYIIGNALITFTIWNLMLIMNMVDYTVNICNNTGMLLRHLTDRNDLSSASQLELELFTARLRSNRLVYKLFGCVVIDKPACLSYIASIVSHVLILVQFDLRRRHENDLRHKNILTQLKDIK